MLKARFVFLCLCLCVHAIAQTVIEWQRTLGGSSSETFYSCQQALDGGFISVALTSSMDGDVTGNHGANDFWVVKLSPDGGLDWKKAYGGTNTDWPHSIFTTTDGGYIVAGYTSSNNGNVSGNHGDKDGWLLKLNATGSIQWQKCLGGSSWDEVWDVKQTQDGGYIVVGRAGSTDGDVSGTNGDLDFWVVKLNSDGIITWEMTFGGSKEETAYKVIETLDNGFLVVGEVYSNDGDVEGQHGVSDFGIIKLDNTGNLIWSRVFGGTKKDWATDVALTNDGGCLVVGNVTSNNGDVTGFKGGTDIWILKLDVHGELVYEKTLGGSNEDRAEGLTRTNDGGYLIAGVTSSTDGDVSINDGLRDFWIVKVDVAGSILWETTVGGSLGEFCYAVVPTSDGGCFAAGATWSNDGDVTGQHGPAGYSDGWVVKFSPTAVSTRTPSTAPLAITPNPAHNTISIQIPDNEPMEQFTCFDALGRPVMVQHVANTTQTIEIATLPPGMYWLQAISAAGKQYMGKFFKH